MSYSKDYSDFQRWIDGIFGAPANTVSTKNTWTYPKPETKADPFEIHSILSNRRKNAFTVVWADGTTTVVHCQPGDEWDDEKALAMCFTKKALGNKGNFNDKFNDALNNKRKIIPGGAGIISKEPQPDISEVVEQLTFVFGGDSDAMCEMAHRGSACECDEPCGDCSCHKDGPVEDTSESYKVYTRINGKVELAKVCADKKSAAACARRLAERMYGQRPYYYRTWTEDDKLTIDFGSHSAYILIEGFTSMDWLKN